VQSLPDWSPDDIDPKIPSAARMYDYILGGFNNFHIDRVTAERMAQASPETVRGARANRSFLRRLVTYLAAEAGITQFLDLGSGIPTAGNVHEIAQRLTPQARIVYVDIDPIAVTLGRRVLADNPAATAIRGDVTEIDAILRHPEVGELIDFGEPVAVLLVSVLHFIADDSLLGMILGRIEHTLPPGSHLAISHFGDTPADTVAKIVAIAKDTPTPSYPRSQAHISSLFGGFELIAPGVLDVARWRPDPGVDPADIALAGWIGGLGVKR
jgi:hypothetical protein